MAWSEERVAKLKKLWSEGLSASQIAGRLGGVTRNAVIGKLSRLGLQRSESPKIRSNRSSQQRQQRRATKNNNPLGWHNRPSAPMKKIALPPASQTDIARKTFEQLEGKDCKWPVGDPFKPGFGFCAATREPGLPYCLHHQLRSMANPVELPLKPEGIQVESETQTKVEEFAD